MSISDFIVIFEVQAFSTLLLGALLIEIQAALSKLATKPEPDWQSIARDLYNAHSGSAGQWERSRERYEKAVGK
jgi:hypothetical protein